MLSLQKQMISTSCIVGVALTMRLVCSCLFVVGIYGLHPNGDMIAQC